MRRLGPHERDHHIRAITGNGLRPEIWREFQDRFAIPRIVEFYGATEGNVSMLNYDGTVGAVGRVPDYLEWLLPTRVVRFDVEQRNAGARAGRALHRMRAGRSGRSGGRHLHARRAANFEGYTNKRRQRKEDPARRVRAKAMPGFAPAI